MALAIESGFPVSNHVWTASTCTKTITTAGASLIVACFYVRSGGTMDPVTVSGGGLTWTKINGSYGTLLFGSVVSGMYYAVSNGALTSQTITATASGGGTPFFGTLVLYSITGAAASPIGASNVASNPSPINVTVNATAASSFVLVVASEQGGTTNLTARTENTPWDDTNLDVSNTACANVGHATTSASGNITVGATDTTNGALASGVEILAAASGATPQDFEQHTMGHGGVQPWSLAAHAAIFAPSLTPALATKPPTNGPPKATVLPEFFLRPWWSPERTHLTRAGWTQTLWAIPPTWKPAPVVPETFARPQWNPERSAAARAGWTQPLWAVPPTKIPEPVLPARFTYPAWNPERSDIQRPASIQSTWAVPPVKIPEPVLPDAVTRPQWNPERSLIIGIPYLPPTWPTTVVAPERFARTPWEPERSHSARAGWTQALWAIAPTKIPDPVLPEFYYSRQVWNPERSQLLWNPLQIAAIVVPVWGYELLGPQAVLRAPWNPERTSYARAGWTQSLWAVPPQKIADPILPERFARSLWSPERSHHSSIALIIPAGPVPTSLPERFPAFWNPERSGFIIAQRIIVAPAPLLSWAPQLLERFVRALRSQPNLDLFAPAGLPFLPTAAFGPPMFGLQDAAALMGKADLVSLGGKQDASGIAGKQDGDGLKGTQDQAAVKGTVS